MWDLRNIAFRKRVREVNTKIKQKILSVCAEKIKQKGDGVQVSFYAFFANKNHDPITLMAVARWWIEEQQLNHFEKATKIYAMVASLDDSSVFQSSYAEQGKGLNHLTLSVTNLDSSLEFYCHLLGFKAEVRWNTGAYLSYGNCWLCLSLGEAKPSRDYTHFAFSFDSSAMSRIQQKNAFQAVKQWQVNSSEGDSLYIEDLDGHKLELHSGSLATRLKSLKAKPYDGLEWLN
jgi:catechol 2,3-dioxygenase-like lactoylglutathione lyase family enzyme